MNTSNVISFKNMSTWNEDYALAASYVVLVYNHLSEQMPHLKAKPIREGCDGLLNLSLWNVSVALSLLRIEGMPDDFQDLVAGIGGVDKVYSKLFIFYAGMDVKFEDFQS